MNTDVIKSTNKKMLKLVIMKNIEHLIYERKTITARQHYSNYKSFEIQLKKPQEWGKFSN